MALRRWFVAVMPSSEEESQWLVGSEAGGAGQRRPGEQRALTAGARAHGHLYTEEMQQQPASPNTSQSGTAAMAAGHQNSATAAQGAAAASGGQPQQQAVVTAAVADSSENDLIDNSTDEALLSQFHEDAVKQVSFWLIIGEIMSSF